MDDNEKRAHDFAISVLQSYLNELEQKTCVDEVTKLASNESMLFYLYYSSYYGFLHAWQFHEKAARKHALHVLARKFHLK